jgi:hypothetical protein
MSDREALLTLAKVAKAFVEWLERFPDEMERWLDGKFDAATETTPRAAEVCSEPVPAVAMTGPGSTQADRWLPGEIGAEPPEPVLYSVVWDGGEFPSPIFCQKTLDECSRLMQSSSRKGTVVPLYAVPVDAAREIAAARREAEEARTECERLRMTKNEMRAIRDAEVEVRGLRRVYIGEPSVDVAATLRGLLARHDKGGAA